MESMQATVLYVQGWSAERQSTKREKEREKERRVKRQGAEQRRGESRKILNNEEEGEGVVLFTICSTQTLALANDTSTSLLLVGWPTPVKGVNPYQYTDYNANPRLGSTYYEYTQKYTLSVLKVQKAAL